MQTVTVKGQFDTNDKYYGHSDIAKMAIREAFEFDQHGKGNWKSIRVTRKFVECTIDGDIVTYTNNGNTIKVIERTYDAVVELDGEMEYYANHIKYYRPE